MWITRRTPVRLGGLIVMLSCPLAACTPGSQDGYRQVQSGDPEGSGRAFMGREIARVLETEHLQPGVDRPAREVRELPERLIAALNLTAADRVADIGSGEGYYSLKLAAHLPSGRVYAVDLQPALLDSVATRARALGFRNIETVLGSETSPNLAPESVDVALIVVSYHEFSHPREMLEALYRSLTPGGRLVVVEYRGEDETIPVSRLHRMTLAQARKEMESVGFEWGGNLEALPQQHVFVFRKPLGDS